MALNYEQLGNPPPSAVGWEGPTINDLLDEQRAFFQTGMSRNIEFRKKSLVKLRKAVADNYSAIAAALQKDLHKPEFELYITEIAFFFQEIELAIKQLKKWAKPRRVRNPWLLWPSRSFTVPEPLGNTLIIGPWNYPFQLTMAPLVAALAAGNTAIVKPSEVAPHTSQIIQKLLLQVFEPEYVTVVEGGAETTQQLLAQRFDKIFFTGGVAVGKIVMEAAAKNLTPVTLELGGKSPTIIAEDAHLPAAARKVAWGKFLNSGQTCLAPDYVLVHRKVKDAFLQEILASMRDFYGEDPLASADYARIINLKHFKRIEGLLEDSQIIFGGQVVEDDLYISPTLLEPNSLEAPIMQEEIFGPLLPIVVFSDIDEAISLINNRPKPLALYLFTRNRATERKVLGETSSGGVVINDTLIHVANSHLPFGGVGESGIGTYHGIHGFHDFSHLKSVAKRRFHFDLLFRYPPYNIPLRWLRKILG